MNSDSFRDKLNRFQVHVTSPSRHGQKHSLPERYERLARAHGGSVVSNHAGAYCLVRQIYPFGYRHGRAQLDEALTQERIPVSAFISGHVQGEVDLDSLLFVDTETTSLGGAGAVAFLIGCGSLTAEGFEVRQYLLPDYEDEAAMLEDLLEELTEDRSLVSYNGSAFDLPIIRDRMIINRVATDVAFRHHLDLLHSTRRLFRRRLKDCRLVNIEKELFEFERVDDIPGYLIPSVYFDWLGEERLDFLPAVLEHNRWDIITMLYLVRLVADVFRTGGEILEEIDDLHSLSRLYGRRRELEQVKAIFDKIDARADTTLAEDVALYHAMNFKRIGELDRAAELWGSISKSDSKEGYWANIELAKYCEHQLRDFEEAIRYAERALEICPYGKFHRERLKSRLERLKRRQNC